MSISIQKIAFIYEIVLISKKAYDYFLIQDCQYKLCFTIGRFIFTQALNKKTAVSMKVNYV